MSSSGAQPPTATEKGVSAAVSCSQARAPGGAAWCSARAKPGAMTYHRENDGGGIVALRTEGEPTLPTGVPMQPEGRDNGAWSEAAGSAKQSAARHRSHQAMVR
jgi:hypothetical protein